VVGDHDLSARPGRVAGICLCQEHSLNKNSEVPTAGEPDF
jgi:hypothetical protein